MSTSEWDDRKSKILESLSAENTKFIVIVTDEGAIVHSSPDTTLQDMSMYLVGLLDGITHELVHRRMQAEQN